MTFDKKTFYARTMHTPDSPQRAELRAALRDISVALIPLHRYLIEAARSDYVFAYEKELDRPVHLLQLLKEDPFFAWLKPLTSVIVDIDEMVRTDFTADAAGAIHDRIDGLVGSAVAEGDFASHYREILQRDVNVAMAHAAVRQALLRLGRSGPANDAQQENQKDSADKGGDQ
ncbi:MAG: hypothetical protein DMF57_14225 [Acidobacteria bacterium]|nr:MAG: hypothetical protein DMF57_14225 [Acidobacteriota bacterium]